jgi:hypothetical protein
MTEASESQVVVKLFWTMCTLERHVIHLEFKPVAILPLFPEAQFNLVNPGRPGLEMEGNGRICADGTFTQV